MPRLRIVLLASALLALTVSLPALARTEPTPTAVPPPVGVPADYALVFEDHFDGTGLNPQHWRPRYADGRAYGAGIAALDSVEQPGDGFLHLTTRVVDGRFETGMIRSVPEFTFGYFEARIRFQSLQGHHGAFWLQADTIGQIHDDPWASGAEIDIIEFFGPGRTGHDAEHNIYYNRYVAGETQPGASHELHYREAHGAELNADFHTFGVLWTPEEYVFFIDGVESWRTSVGVSGVAQHIVLSLTTSAWENPRLPVDQLPDTMLVDWVRVYQ